MDSNIDPKIYLKTKYYTAEIGINQLEVGLNFLEKTKKLDAEGVIVLAPSEVSHIFYYCTFRTVFVKVLLV